MGILAKFFGTKNDREIKAMMPRIEAIKTWEPRLKDKRDAELTGRIAEIRTSIEKALADTKKKPKDLLKADVNRILDPHLEEVFAITREASRRVLGMRHYDVQFVGGMVLHSGKIAEMKTGEGKTLVATAPAILNALTGYGVHVVTVNDYLASRDAEWMGRLYRFLGLTSGVVVPHQNDRIKREAYQSDITYGQNNEFGFDYLRDNMKLSLKDYMQRGHAFSIVDEVDSILIDEARTPLIISGPSDEGTEQYKVANEIIPQLRKDEHYTLDEKNRTVHLTEEGIHRCEELLKIDNLYDLANIAQLHHITQSLRAYTLYKRDVHYMIEKGEVIIIDENTGRKMIGRRWSDGLHGAVEAKENVRIQAETQTLATISFQNYFRMYRKLSGMTGTAETESEEFAKIYDLDVVVIPTNKEKRRIDDEDLIYKTEREKVNAIVNDIQDCYSRKQPVLVGTVSVEKSEVLSKKLDQIGVEHRVLNAKRHKEEASIVAQAGRLGAVTIATNMAGRGTDILLGGNPEFLARTEVMRQLAELDPQGAQWIDFTFLSGPPDLINVEKLAERDSKDYRFTEPYVRLMEEMLAAQEQGASVDAASDTDIPMSREAIRQRVYDERVKYYREGVDKYREALVRSEATCAEEKRQVLEAGGLRIIGTERHDSRRIDNQLRGRAGRQGDPGSSRFYLSLQDDLMRIFGSEKMIRVMEALGMKDDMPIEAPMVTKSIANAQKRVEGMHFDSRKSLIEYDDVMNQQRKAIYGIRRSVLDGENLREMILDLVEDCIIQNTQRYCPEKAPPSEWKVDTLAKDIAEVSGVEIDPKQLRRERDALMDTLYRTVEKHYLVKEKELGTEAMRQAEAYTYLTTLDTRWKEHLLTMDHLRDGIHLRGYGQKDPKQEYKKEGFNLFVALRSRMRDEILDKIFRLQPQRRSPTIEELAQQQRAQSGAQLEQAIRQAQNRLANQMGVRARPAAGAVASGAPAGRVGPASGSTGSPVGGGSVSGSVGGPRSTSLAGSSPLGAGVSMAGPSFTGSFGFGGFGFAPSIAGVGAAFNSAPVNKPAPATTDAAAETVNATDSTPQTKAENADDTNASESKASSNADNENA